MLKLKTDLIIAGAGPAGATMALMLADSGLQVTIIDKDRFPRDKICGDALSGQALSVLKRMPSAIFEAFLEVVPKTPANGICFVSPDFHKADMAFSSASDARPRGYVCPRREFDAFLVSKFSGYRNITFLEGQKLIRVEEGPAGVTATTTDAVITGKLIAGADGVHSVVRTSLCGSKPSKGQLCTGIRAYFEGVTGFHPKGYIELFFLGELLPFYLWIFPEVNGRCNAGIALLQTDIAKRKVNLGELFTTLIHTHPLIAPRFAASRMTGRAEAHALPLGTKPGPLSGNRFLLLGDAACLVDPFTGEGIGNAMASGEVAARVVQNALSTGDLQPGALKEYDRQLKRRIGREIKASAWLQTMAHSARLVNFLVRKAGKRARFNQDRLNEPITRIGFWLRLLFR